VKPARERQPVAPRPATPGKRQAIPAAVKRAVWERDGGRCTYVSPGGRRCEDRRRLEFDHIEPVALGGRSTVDGLRLRCKSHNTLHAEETFGRGYMARFRRRPESRTGESTIAGERALEVTPAAALAARPRTA
jgi:5-methylcytosine-specific restriction endonuclease McrA